MGNQRKPGGGRKKSKPEFQNGFIDVYNTQNIDAKIRRIQSITIMAQEE